MKYKKLKHNFADTASWAVWDEEQPANTDIITQKKDTLRNDVVLLSLFPHRQSPEQDWGNFHGDKAGNKLMQLFGSSSYRGAYITSLYKQEGKTGEEQFQEKQLQLFIKEMKWLGAKRKTLFVLFGQDTKNIFFDQLIHRFNNVALCEHYASFRLTADEWADHNEALLQEHQRKVAISFKLKPFRRFDQKYV